VQCLEASVPVSLSRSSSRRSGVKGFRLGYGCISGMGDYIMSKGEGHKSNNRVHANRTTYPLYERETKYGLGELRVRVLNYMP